jgi:nucleotide-binding universal stress UspA family protein
MFHTILLVVDQAEEANAAAYVAGLPGTSTASVRVFHPLHDGGLTRRGQDSRLAHAVADEARSVGPDLIVLGVDRRQVGRHHLSGSLREQLAELTHLPVMAPPTWAARSSVSGPLTKRLAHV